jgi:hypothetical protein
MKITNPSIKELPNYLSVRQVGEMTSLTRQRIFKAIKNGTLKASRVDDFYLIRRQDAERFIKYLDDGMVHDRRFKAR